jgi:hypothetical protein
MRPEALAIARTVTLCVMGGVWIANIDAYVSGFDSAAQSGSAAGVHFAPNGLFGRF